MSKKGINIYKRKDGRWEARYIKEYINNKPKFGYLYGKSYSETKEKLINNKREDVKKPIDIFMYDISTEWLKTVKIKVKQSTYTKYYSVIERYIKNYIGDIYVTDLTSVILADYTEKLQQLNLSNKTIRDILCIVGMILKYYRKTHNPNFYISINYPKYNKREIKILTENEILLLENYLMNDMDIKKIGILLTLYTGLSHPNIAKRIGRLESIIDGEVERTFYLVGLEV